MGNRRWNGYGQFVAVIPWILCMTTIAMPARAQDDPSVSGQAAANPVGDGELTPEVANKLANLLDRDWDERPEWAEMLVMVLKGQTMRMGPGTGWFRDAQKKYDWLWLLDRFDINADRVVQLAELPASPQREFYFTRLDLNRDGELTGIDFSRNSYSVNPFAKQTFTRLDTDSNGRLSQEEWQKFFSRSDRDERGFLTPEDFQAAFSPAPPRPGPANQPPRPSQMPPTTYWLNMLVNGELGSLSNGPNVGDPAPDFKLTTYQGDTEVALSSFKGTKPVVLIFGSFT